MSATMIDMELINAGKFKVSELMEDDLIKIDNEIVTIVSIEDDAYGETYFVKHINDFGEEDISELNVDDEISLFVFAE
jgi:hypothetical protein